MKILSKILSVALLSFCALNMSAADKEQKAEPKNNFKLYGFVRNYFAFDSRESVSGTGDLFYYMPKDVNMVNGEDLNATPSFTALALTSRLGVDVTGYNIGNVSFGAKIEGDFYAGLSAVDKTKQPNIANYFPGNTNISGTATARLRQAYATVTWKDLPLAGDQKASVALKMGQAWHPMGADFPHVFSLEVAAPFGPFSRTPQITMDANLGQNWVVSASALWQMQYNSQGPVGGSAIYMKYGMTPEMYAAVTYKNKGALVRLGADLLSIKPRVLGSVDGAKVRVSDRKTSMLYYAYAQYTYKKFALKAKSTWGESGEHLNLMSGYAKVGENADGSWNYASLRSSSTWLSMIYGKKWQGVLLLGYMKALGFADPLDSSRIPASDVYYCGNGFSNINQIYRINPQVVYNIGKMNIGLEYQWTSVQYGKYITDEEGVKYLNSHGLATDGLHWVGNHRVNLMVKYNF
ncbi:MAG: hypothetical protein IKT59_10415 [Bacteroidales bacterium]|nr:hypothetical protein [Bacteroidales bacterium]